MRVLGIISALVVSVVASSVPAGASATSATHQPHDSIRLLSESYAGEPLTGDSSGASVTADGDLIAFSSQADLVVEDDTNGQYDAFVRNRSTDETDRVTFAMDGGDPDSDCLYAAIAGGGRYVIFESRASNLVSEPTYGNLQTYLYDRKSHTTRLLTRSVDGNGGNGDTLHTAINGSGRFVVVTSSATNLVQDDGNGRTDAFLFDTKSGTTELLTRDIDGGPANGDTYGVDISKSGNIVAFDSYASDLVDDDTNGSSDVFVVDRRTGVTTLVSRNRAGAPASGMSFSATLSRGGDYVGFSSDAADLAGRDHNGVSDAFVRNLTSGKTRLISRTPDGHSARLDSYIEAIGRHARAVTFLSWSDDLVDNPDENMSTDVFVRYRKTGIALISRTPDGVAAESGSYGSAIDNRAKFIAFESASDDLVEGVPSGWFNVYLYKR